MKRWLLGLPSVGNQTGDEIDDKVGCAPMRVIVSPSGDTFKLMSLALREHGGLATCLTSTRSARDTILSEQDVKGREQDARFVSDAWYPADKRKRVLLVRDVQVGAGTHL